MDARVASTHIIRILVIDKDVIKKCAHNGCKDKIKGFQID